MRRKDREVKEIQEMQKIIDSCKVCRIAMQDKDGLYIVPMNFGYSFENGILQLYFHSAKEGRKIEAFKENSDICFEMDCEHRLIDGGDNACKYSYAYRSIIGNGRVVFIEEPEEKKLALSALMRHQTGRDFEITDKMTEGVSLFKILASEFSGKEAYYNR